MDSIENLSSRMGKFTMRDVIFITELVEDDPESTARELTTMGRDGQIRSKDTIKPGNDPNPPKDTEH